jgi:hypothetical protein
MFDETLSREAFGVITSRSRVLDFQFLPLKLVNSFKTFSFAFKWREKEAEKTNKNGNFAVSDAIPIRQ